ncbi:MAG: alpha-amylase [Prevotellaceae bacterium]|jgi:glycosidase|nr:alpha-amylase [Prevotellaceae bacterium]
MKTKFTSIAFLVLTLVFFSCNHQEKAYQNVPEAKDVVMYEVNPRVFAKQDALKAVTERLDEIKALGTNVIWIMPIYEEGVLNAKTEEGGGSPYCIKDYKKIDPEYGTLEDLQNLVRKAHEKGMAVILDWVANHTAWDNEWLAAHPSWYTHDSIGNITHPATTDWTDVADLNYANDSMRTAMIDAMKYWFSAANIDGFRCDALDFIPETDFLQRMTTELRELNKSRRILMLAEGNLQDYPSLGFDMDYGWSFYDKMEKLYENKISIAEFLQIYKAEKDAIPAGKSRLYFTTNHDKSAWEKTDVQLFGCQRAAMSAFALTATLTGAPLIYSTQEIGADSLVSFFKCTQVDWTAKPEILNEYKQIMAVYTQNPAFKGDSLETFSDNPDVVYFTRSDGKERVLVAENVRNEAKKLTLPATLAGVSAVNLINNNTETLPETIDLQPYQYSLWKLK